MEIKRSDASPVFILGAGWRCGSTLLQRMCMEEYFVWGEPYGTAGLIPNMCDNFFHAIRAFGPETYYSKYYYDGKEPLNKLQERFVANLSPEWQQLVDAHIAWFEALFARQEKWGIKEVRLDANHAIYLRHLFPKAKIVFLYRNPYDCYRSAYKWMQVPGNKLWDYYPQREIDTSNFGGHWRYLTQGFIDNAKQLRAYVISYENLCKGHWEGLENYLGFKLSRKAFEYTPYDGFGGKYREHIDLSFLQKQVDPLAHTLGYSLEEQLIPAATRELWEKHGFQIVGKACA